MGGLPIGVSGNVCILFDDQNQNSVAAAWLLMKRGCRIFPVSLRSGDVSVAHLDKFAYGHHLNLNTFKSSDDLNRFIADNKCLAFVTADTFETFESAQKSFDNIRVPLLFPLIAYDQKDIDKLLDKIR